MIYQRRIGELTSWHIKSLNSIATKLTSLHRGVTNLIFVCTHFRACKMVLCAHLGTQNYVHIKQWLWVLIYIVGPPVSSGPVLLSVCPSCPSALLSVSFLKIGSLVFSETLHGVRGPYIVVCDRGRFWKKSSLGKNDQKWSKMTQKHGFLTF